MHKIGPPLPDLPPAFNKLWREITACKEQGTLVAMRLELRRLIEASNRRSKALRGKVKDHSGWYLRDANQ